MPQLGFVNFVPNESDSTVFKGFSPHTINGLWLIGNNWKSADVWDFFRVCREQSISHDKGDLCWDAPRCRVCIMRHGSDI